MEDSFVTRLLHLWSKLPAEWKDAIVTGVVVNAATAAFAFRAWVRARFFKGAFTNTVEAIHNSECADCAEAARAANTKDGIEEKVKPLVTKIKAELDAAAAKEGKKDAPPASQ